MEGLGWDCVVIWFDLVVWIYEGYGMVSFGEGFSCDCFIRVIVDNCNIK